MLDFLIQCNHGNDLQTVVCAVQIRIGKQLSSVNWMHSDECDQNVIYRIEKVDGKSVCD